MSSAVDHNRNVRALLGLFAVLGRRGGGTTQREIHASTKIGTTRIQRLSGTWRKHLDCPSITLEEIHALASFAAPVLGIDQKIIALWIAGLSDKRQQTAVEAAIRRSAKAAVERQVTLSDVDLPDGLAELIRK